MAPFQIIILDRFYAGENVVFIKPTILVKVQDVLRVDQVREGCIYTMTVEPVRSYVDWEVTDLEVFISGIVADDGSCFAEILFSINNHITSGII